MKKARLIGHLSELDNIRRDEYMPQEVIDKVVELEKILTRHLTEELLKPTTAGTVHGERPFSYDSSFDEADNEL